MSPIRTPCRARAAAIGYGDPDVEWQVTVQVTMAEDSTAAQLPGYALALAGSSTRRASGLPATV